jgi:hypothetical protein
MTQTRPWTLEDQEKARAQDYVRQEKASAKYVRVSPKWLAEHMLLELQDIIKEGLPHCYASFKEATYDLWMELSFTGQRQQEIQIMLADERWPKIQKQITEKFNFNIEAEFRKDLPNMESTEKAKNQPETQTVLDKSKRLYKFAREMQQHHLQMINKYDQIRTEKGDLGGRALESFNALNDPTYKISDALQGFLGSLEDEFGPEVSKD